MTAEKHTPTEQCGFDRSASINEDRYVCLCGYRSADSKSPAMTKPTVQELLKLCNSILGAGNPAMDARVTVARALRERLVGEQQTRFFCTRCGYVGATEQHDGCNYSAMDINTSSGMER
jgi:hypothetical protein